MSLDTYLCLEFVKPAYIAEIGVYKASLLEAIAAFGSISAAACVMKADPRTLQWTVGNINEGFGDIIVLKRGRSGGAFVTAEGLALLQQFRRIEESVRRVFAKDLREIEKLIGSELQGQRPWLEYDRWRQLSPPKIEDYRRKAYATKSRIVNSTPVSAHVFLAIFSEKLWIGEGFILVLRAIARYGSIAAAARAMGWTYYDVVRRTRWLNRNLGEIVLTQRGRGGGVTLSPRGVELVERFCTIHRSIHDTFARELVFAAHLAGGDKGTKINRRIARWLEARGEFSSCDDICIRSGVR